MTKEKGKMSIQDYALQLLEESGKCDIKTNKEIIRLWAYLKDYEGKYLGNSVINEIRSRLSEHLIEYIQEQCDFYDTIYGGQKLLNIMLLWFRNRVALTTKQLNFVKYIVANGIMPFCQHRVEELHKFVEKVRKDDELMSQGGFR